MTIDAFHGLLKEYELTMHQVRNTSVYTVNLGYRIICEINIAVIEASDREMLSSQLEVELRRHLEENKLNKTRRVRRLAYKLPSLPKNEEKREKKDPALQRRARHIQRQYNLSIEQYINMFKEQNGVCKICGRPPRGKHRVNETLYLNVDHDHKTGEVRGLLCSQCNTALGLLEDNPQYLRNAADYLDHFKK